MLKKQKLVAVFLVFSLIIGILPVSVLAADTTGSFEATGGMVYYEIDDASQTVTITGCDTTVTAIEIPNSLESCRQRLQVLVRERFMAARTFQMQTLRRAQNLLQ